jgi:hypothetical protein
MRKSKKLLSMLFAFVMVISLFGGLTAFAADTDPNMTAYNFQYTYVVNRADIPLSGTTINIYAVPANSSWSPTYFDTDTAAEAVTWTRASGSTAGITAGSVSAYEIGDDQYASCLPVNLSGTMAHGPEFPCHEPADRWLCGYSGCRDTFRV